MTIFAIKYTMNVHRMYYKCTVYIMYIIFEKYAMTIFAMYAMTIFAIECTMTVL